MQNNYPQHALYAFLATIFVVFCAPFLGITPLSAKERSLELMQQGKPQPGKQTYRAGLNARWIEQASGFTTASRGIRALDAVNENVAWAVAYDGSGGNAVIQEFTRTTNGGATWTPGTITSDATAFILNISAVSATEAWASVMNTSPTGSKGIFYTNNGGQTWTKQASALYNSSTSFINWVSFIDASNGVTGGDPVDGFFEVYTTSNGGQNWARVPNANMPPALANEWGLSNLFYQNGNRVWFGTTMGRIFMSEDKGMNWIVSAPFPTNVSLSSLAFGGNTGVAVGIENTTNNMVVSRTRDRGATWSNPTYETPGGVSVNGISFVPGTVGTYVVSGSRTGMRGTAVSQDGGFTWTNLNNDVQHLEVDFVSPTVGWSGGFARSSTEGGMFKIAGSLATAPSGSQVGWVVQENAFSTETGNGIKVIDAVNENVVWALVYSTGAFDPTRTPKFIRTTNGGTTWMTGEMAGLAGANMGTIDALSATEAYVTVNAQGGAQGVYRTTDGGQTWVKQATAVYSGATSFPNFITFLDGTTGVTGGDPLNGFFEIYTTNNSGQAWTRVPNASMPAALTNEYGITDDFTKMGNTIWFGTSQGRVFKSTDKGLTWTVSSPFATNVLVSNLAFNEGGVGIAVGIENTTNNMLVARTSNGGATWSTAVYETLGGISVNDIAFVPGTLSTFVVTGARQGMSGSAYTTDGGTTWALIDQGVQHLEVAFTGSASGWSGGFNRMFKFTGSLATIINGLAQEASERALQVYPNPTSADLTVVVAQETRGGRVKLYNLNGQVVLDQAMGGLTKTLSLAHLPKGLYILQVTSTSGVVKKKVVVE